jgi:hypothetical protein
VARGQDSRWIHGLHRHGARIRSIPRKLIHAGPRPVGVLANVHNLTAVLRPDVEVGYLQVPAEKFLGTEKLNRRPASPVQACAREVAKRDTVVLDPPARLRLALRPGGVEVEGVGVAVAGEIGKQGVVEESAAAIGLDHQHLVAVLGVDVLVGDSGDIWEPVRGWSKVYEGVSEGNCTRVHAEGADSTAP